jgi:ankyrin repeat protein
MQASPKMNPALADVLEQIRQADLPQFMGVNLDRASIRSLTSGETPLHIVAIWGDVEAAKVLLDAGADIDALGEEDHTPLHEAIHLGHIEMVRLLVGRGADLQRRCSFGSAVELAARSANPEIAAAVQSA